ncbi:TPA: hypothetical protein ACGZ9U_003508 [Elizabethkingia anophelis]
MKRRKQRIDKLRLISILQKQSKEQFEKGIISKDDYLYTLRYIYDKLCDFENYSESFEAVTDLINNPSSIVNVIAVVDLINHSNLN